MKSSSTKKVLKQKLRRKFRNRVFGTASRPRLSVFRSNRAIYAQIIDDTKGLTLASAGQKEIKEGKTKMEKAKLIGLLIAKKIKTKKIDSVVFDRGSYKYHGRVKAIAEGAREGGLNF